MISLSSLPARAARALMARSTSSSMVSVASLRHICIVASGLQDPFNRLERPDGERAIPELP